MRGEALIQTVMDTLIQAASHCFDIRLESQLLTETEWHEIQTVNVCKR